MRTQKYVINPVSGRKVLAKGRVGKQVLKGGTETLAEEFMRLVNEDNHKQLKVNSNKKKSPARPGGKKKT